MFVSRRLPIGLSLASFLTLSCSADAADYLRGAYGSQEQTQSSSIDWAGFYGGAHAGFSSYTFNPSPFNRSLAKDAMPYSYYQDLLVKTINLHSVGKNAATFGVFGGVNWQWDDVVLGFEGDYTRSNISAAGSYGPYVLTDSINARLVDLQSSSMFKTSLKQWGTIRGRAGWAAGFFMPYITAGLAFAQSDTNSSVSGSWESYNFVDTSDDAGKITFSKRTVVESGSFSGKINKSSLVYGGAFGVGIDMQLIPNTFLRAEWMHVQLAPNGSQTDISFDTARIAGGVKF